MALSLENILFVKQKARAETRRPKVQAALKALFSYLSQHKGNPNLQFVPFENLSSGSTVIADAPARLVGLYLDGGVTTASFVKLTNDAATASATAPDVSAKLNTGQNEEFLAWPDGMPFSTGIAARADITAAGSTGSVTTSRPSGFAILAGP